MPVASHTERQDAADICRCAAAQFHQAEAVTIEKGIQVRLFRKAIGGTTYQQGTAHHSATSWEKAIIVSLKPYLVWINV